VRLAAGSLATVRRSGPIRLVAVPLLVALAALIWLDPPWVERVQSAWFDAYQVASPRHVASMPATIVEIDQKSLARSASGRGRGPVLAQLVRDINRHRPQRSASTS
jgi:CHASE2 domain-containing sensor protein